MVLPIITIFVLLTSNSLICMDNNNNNFKENPEYDSGDEAKKINDKITNEQNEKYLEYEHPILIDLNEVKAFFEKHYPDLKAYSQSYKDADNDDNDEKSHISVTLEKELNRISKVTISQDSYKAAEEFKKSLATTSNYISKAKKAPSQASSDFLKISENEQ